MSQAPQKILLICSDAGTLESLGKYLVQQQFDVRCACCVQEVNSCFAQWPADLIICDQEFAMRPAVGRPGDLTMETLGEFHKKIRKIIITRPGETPDFRQLSTHNHVAAFLGRPFKPEDLMYYIKSALEISATHLNRREHNRYLFDVDTHCVLINPFDDSEGRPMPALMRDVSRSGVSMIVHQLLPVPAMIKVVVQFSDNRRPVAMLAKTISCALTQMPGVYRLGARFVGLLPREMTHAIATLSRQKNEQLNQDVFMGKSFRDAVREWLERHHEDFKDEEGHPHHTPLDELSEHLARVPSYEDSTNADPSPHDDPPIESI